MIILGGIAAVAIAAFLFKDQIAAAIQNAGSGFGGGEMVTADTGGGTTDLDVSGGGCACANGKCIGNCSGNVYAGDLPSGMTPMEFVKSKVPGAFGGYAHRWAYMGRANPSRRHFIGINKRGGRSYRR